MSVGEGIFFGLALLSLVALYVATKDRWRWRRTMFWVCVLFTAWLVTLLGLHGFAQYSNSRPHYQTGFWELQPGMTTEELVFRKGQPTERSDRWWLYFDDADKVGYVVGMKDGKTRFIQAVTRDGDSVYLPSLQGINYRSSPDDLNAKFGEPDGLSVSGDGTRRQLSFSKYGVSFQLQKNRVTSVGVFDPKAGPIRFHKESEPPPSSGSAPSARR